MKRSWTFLGFGSMLLALLVLVVTIGGTYFLNHSVNSQERVLLQSDDDQLALVLNEAVTGIETTLSSLVQYMALTHDSASEFAAQTVALTYAKPPAKPMTSVALARMVAGRYTVALAAGPNFVVGQTVPAALATAMARLNPKLPVSATPLFRIRGNTFFGMAAGGAPGPSGTVILYMSLVHPNANSATASGPYSQLNISLYTSPRADPSQLLAGTFGRKPLSAPTVRAYTTVGGTKWLILAAARHSLVGSASRNAPWIFLGAGILITLLLGVSTQLITRRREYAEGLVLERTSQLVEAQAALVRNERLSAVGEMATVIGHELRNPLGAAINLLFLARGRLTEHDDPELDGYLNRMEREVTRAATLSEDLTAYMRERVPAFEHLHVGALVAEVLESTPPPAGIGVSVADHGVEVEADRAQLVQMLTNLVTNAYQAMPDGGSLGVKASESNGFVEIMLEDSGAGIDPADAEHLLDPFVTTKVTGTGLGLAIVKRLAEGHDGSVTLENGPTVGARATIRLPQHKAEATQ